MKRAQQPQDSGHGEGFVGSDDDKGEVTLHVGPMVSPTAADRVGDDDGIEA